MDPQLKQNPLSELYKLPILTDPNGLSSHLSTEASQHRATTWSREAELWSLALGSPHNGRMPYHADITSPGAPKGTTETPQDPDQKA